ncbi:MAG: transposase [Betaproteobacteria bacterium RBG_19FT_COMBO_58_11]|nr:MAG: transposase [Betaproteobacteria bacterium RBG_19FT_COMBO_58_11]
MRVVQHQQMSIGEVDVSKITFDARSRDDIPKILRGLQHIYTDPSLRTAVFELLTKQIAPKADKSNGRPGMTLWSILVCGVVRLDLNIDYDRLQELVNQHTTLREMLGHGTFDKEHYAFQTLKDNVMLLTPELLDKINQIVVPAGHALLKKKENEALRGRCDSFVVETHVHYPTDINLLYDAMRKVITLTAQWCAARGLSDWRQSAYNVRCLKRLMRTAQNKKRGKAKSAEQVTKNEALIIKAHREYLDVAQACLTKAGQTLILIGKQGYADVLDVAQKLEIEGFIQHAERQIGQIKRRVILGEAIPHGEKVFSIFEPHTEWISKGKAGVSQELGLRVCILEDQHQFILHHQVMEKKTDDQVTVAMVVEAKARFSTLNACSFDKGFHSQENQIALKEQLALVALPRKGKLSQPDRAVEQSKEFVSARRAHSAVESAINALEVHGLDRCPDHGIDGFKRYVALAVVARNIHRIGAILSQRELRRLQRAAKYSDRETTYKLAA